MFKQGCDKYCMISLDNYLRYACLIDKLCIYIDYLYQKLTKQNYFCNNIHALF